MAKILAPYALCPLTERKRFVGVSSDSESGCIIVTLAKNIIIRYRLSNQKQVSSWSTKAMLSAPVIYDHASKLYYGIFNCDEVASWEEHVVSLGKLNKTKFVWLIHSVLSSEDSPAVIVYKNGIITPLKTDLPNSRNPPEVNEDQLLPSQQTIKDARLVSFTSVHYVVIHTTTDEGVNFLHFLPVDQDRGTKSSVKIHRDDVRLTAHVVIDGETPHLVTLWSNGELYSLGLPVKDSFPGKLISKVKCIDPSQPAVLLQLGQEHLVMYGAAPNSEGAYLVILSRQFGLPECTTKMKVYDDECRVWTCRNNIVLVLGGHLVVAPFRLDTVKLVSLIGVDRKARETTSLLADNTPEGITARIAQMKEEGTTEYSICDFLFPDLMEAKNTKGLEVVIDNVLDIPDKYLVQLAVYAVNEDERLLRKVMRIPLIGDHATITLVRQKLALSPALQMMKVVTNMLKDDEIDKCTLDWAALLCDALYLQYLLSKDEEVVTIIRQLQEAVEDHIDSVVTYRSLLAEINYFKRGKVSSKTPSVSSHSYVVEKIKLY